MNTQILRQIKTERYLFGIIMAFLMVFVAEYVGKTEIIFPEVCALTIGAWICEQQPWNTNKRRIFTLMTLASLFGILIVRYIDLPMIFQVCVGFAFTGFMLTIFRTNFVPIISACILPIYLRTSSLIYPISVSSMALIIIIAQWLMEKYHFRPINRFTPYKIDLKNDILKWSNLLLVFAIIALIPFKMHQIYFLAPPLLVMFTELSNSNSPARKKPIFIIGLMTFGAFIGCLLRLILNIHFGIPLFVCTALACVILFVALDKLKLYFPPAGAILIIPMIIDKTLLIRFPFEVLIGSICLCYSALLLFNERTKTND